MKDYFSSDKFMWRIHVMGCIGMKMRMCEVSV